MDIMDVFEKFPTQKDCLKYLEQVRWQGKPMCPYCGSTKHTPAKQERRYHCNNCNTTYSVTVGTIFHKTHLPIQKWFLAVTMILSAKKGIAARQLARHLQVNRNTAWRISMQIREAMRQKEQRDMLTGIVEMDETYIGGKPRKQGPDDIHHKRGRGTDKTPIVAMIERGGKIKAKVVRKKDLNLKKLSALVRETVDTQNAVLMTDEYGGYFGISKVLPHETVNHRVWYVDRDKHTNTVESFWALLKRGIVGQFHKVSLKHLPKYVDEFCYRHNNRKHEDTFGLTIQHAVGVC